MNDWIPLLGDLRHYRPEWLSRDLIAGLSVTAVQIPTAIAYANLAGFPPETGLYASLIPVLIYGLFGSSRQLVLGPDAATCALIAAILAPLAGGDLGYYLQLSAGLAIMAGLLMVIGGFTGMGFIVNFFARPILIGFLNGIALSIIVGQMAKLLGVALTNQDVFPVILELLEKLDRIHWPSLMVGAGTLLLLTLVRRFLPRAPAALVALVLGGLAVYLLGWGEAGVRLVGLVPAGLPTLALPQIGYEGGQSLAGGALGLVIVSFTSGMLTARSFAARTGDSIDADREMRAFGFANVASGLFGGFAVTGADSRTAVNVASGGKTQLVSVVAALATGVVALFLTQPLGQLPIPALGAVLIFSAWGLLDLAAYRELLVIDRLEFGLALGTTLGVLVIGVLPGVMLAILLALSIVLIRIYRPQDVLLGIVPGLDGYNDLELSRESRPVPGALLYRFEAPLLFFNAELFKSRVLSLVDATDPKPAYFVLSMESISQLDTTGALAIKEVHAQLQGRGIQFMIARPKLYMSRFGHPDWLGDAFIFRSVRAAVEAIEWRQAGADPATRPLSLVEVIRQAD
ncbi:MAG: SulP family inorganic anion transporter [Chromatiaceae bacterium]